MLSFILTGVLLKIVVSKPNMWEKLKPPVRLFYLPCFLGFFPLLIWYSFYTYHSTEFNSGGFSAKPVLQAIGYILIYLSILFIVFSYCQADKSLTSSSKEFWATPMDLPLIANGVSRYLNSWISLLCTLIVVVFLFQIVMALRQIGYREKNYYLQSVNIPPPNTAPAGFEQFSDSSLRVSFVYPEGWLVENADEGEAVVRIFHDPSTFATLGVSTFPVDSFLTNQERLNMLNSIIFGADHDNSYLLNRSTSIQMQTNAGVSDRSSGGVLFTRRTLFSNS